MALPFAKKLLGVGLILMLVSLFLPWYQDLDSFKTGDMFLGITGPLYLAGVSLLLMVAANIALMIMEVYDRKPDFLKVKSAHVFLASGIFAFYILMIVNSVYFHQKFGVNITIKQSGFGMFFAFISASLITIGGYLAGRDRVAAVHEFEKEANADLVKAPIIEQRKPAGGLRAATGMGANIGSGVSKSANTGSGVTQSTLKPVAKPMAQPTPKSSTAFADLKARLQKNLEIKGSKPEQPKMSEPMTVGAAIEAARTESMPMASARAAHGESTLSGAPKASGIQAEEARSKGPQSFRMDL